ncbi:hypothetical protein Hypma_002540 [Hypsizygus marmoreus]|uniref:F-box domain-containing protein n=1 Tax=Hypsizygus marmoreus TaxID=39966 RepID=A0A369J8Z8_HYPMA|nr:hypothetical protein Hypma_002540 [Hypsizygus marmoreus]
MSYLSPDRPLLVDDVLLQIFCFCDILSILVLSQSSHHFHDLAFSKQVWLTLLSDLHRRNFIDLLPEQHLNQLTSNELVDLAKRTVSGPRSWSCPAGPTITHQVVFTSSITNLEDPSNYYSNCGIRLLSGGQFVLFQHQATLECLSINGGKHVWQYRGSWEDYEVRSFAAEVVDEGQAVIIMVGVRISDQHRRNFVEILRLDLRMGSAKTLVLEPAPNTLDESPFTGFKICGDFAIANVQVADYILMFRLSTGTSKRFKALGLQEIDLIPGHLLVLTPNPTHVLATLELCVWSLDSLFESTVHNPLVTDISSISTVTIDAPINCAARLTSLPSPIHNDSSTLWICVKSTGRDQAGSLLHKYHISHAKGHPLSVELVATVKLDESHPTACYVRIPLNISYSGRAEFFNHSSQQQRSFSFTSPDDDIPLDLPGCGYYIHMSSYSGALTYVTEHVWDERIYVNYYE